MVKRNIKMVVISLIYKFSETKKDLKKFVNTLHKSGYVYGFNESLNESKTKGKSFDSDDVQRICNKRETILH